MSDDTRTQLEEERRIINAATAGPWGTAWEPNAHPRIWGDLNSDEPAKVTEPCSSRENAEFIAHARTALPLRNAQVEAVLALIEEMDKRPVSADTVDHYIEMGFQLAARKIRRAIEEAADDR